MVRRVRDALEMKKWFRSGAMNHGHSKDFLGEHTEEWMMGYQGLRRWIQEAPRNLLRLHIGVFWAAKWEVRVNRAKKIKEPRQTDQWIQQADGVRLAALWLCGRTAAQMRAGDAVARTWDPEPASLPSH